MIIGDLSRPMIIGIPLLFDELTIFTIRWVVKSPVCRQSVAETVNPREISLQNSRGSMTPALAETRTILMIADHLLCYCETTSAMRIPIQSNRKQKQCILD